ncbi:amidohydrolase family protein [Methylovirgula sp. 4M-Z18]|uniref:amidohydrolase family protein n=1 Tax=Methylovirgula sp. 4M-Z18 TaxID=2293567 RepID=UPI00403F3835
MFRSDRPVCLQAGSYAEALNALRGVLDPALSADQRAAVYGLNAIRFYRVTV